MRTATTLALLSSRVVLFAPPISAFLRSPPSSHFVTHSASLRSMLSTKRVLVPIADDSEEIETACITDTLVRFGAEVVVASVKPGGDLVCKMSRGLKVVADIPIEEATGQSWDLVALPGGMPGAEHLRDCPALISLLEKQKSQNKLYGAICASPAVVLAAKGLVGQGATCYPAAGLRSLMDSPVEEEVVVQENVVTSKGPATALTFALKLGELLYGSEKAKSVREALLC